MSLAENKERTSVKPALKSIKLRRQNLAQAQEIESKLGLSPIASRILSARGFKADKKLKDYLQPSLKDGLPVPKDLKNLEQASHLIADIIKSGKSVAICCDFDVDGLSAGAQLQHFFQSNQIPSEVFVPDRFEDGYGLNEKVIRKVALANFGVLICVDFGTTNSKELELARELGLKTVVVDHHHVPEELCAADCFINPHQPGCGFADKILCAAGLAWYLVLGLRRALKKSASSDAKSYLDLACLGTICDMVPLIGANRVIAKRGLELLTTTERVGLKALKNVIGLQKQIGCHDVSFGIGPRLNAAGRMENAQMVIDLLTTLDSDKAAKFARVLNKLNLERQEVENDIKEKAVRQVYEGSVLPNGIAVWERNYHTGVIGIVAQRLVETFYRPSAVMGLDVDGIYKGSVRGIKDFSVVQALQSVSKYLVKFGGHEGAGGFSIKEANLESFAEAFDEECRQRLENIDSKPYIEADTEVTLMDLSEKLVDELKQFAPFGMGNPGPCLFVRNLKVQDIRVLKDAHLKLTLSDGKRTISGLMWRQKSHAHLVKDAKVNLAFKADINNFNGLQEVQLNLLAAQAV